jgi:DNA-binding SARP family transcriptional activator
MSQVIRASLLGPVALSVDGRPPPSPLLWRKNVALLVYLRCSPRQSRSREHLIGLLWPDKPEDRARHSLNVALNTLRGVLGEALESDEAQVGLRPGAVTTDLEEFEAHAAAGRWKEAAQLVAGDFLQGNELKDAPAFDDWLAAQRLGWRGRVTDALLRHAAVLLDAGRLTGARDTARFALSLDPFLEAALRLEVRALALAGERSQALRRADEFAARLGAEVRAALSGETRTLLERVKSERMSAPAQPAGTGPSTRRLSLVGREPELGGMLRVWSECRSELRSRLILLRGEVGAGKTRLLEEFASRARLDGATVALARAVEADLSEDGGSLWALARGDLRRAPGVVGALPGAIASLAARLVEWQNGFAKPAGAAPMPLPAALEEVVRAATEEGPVILILDDAHWSDRPSLLALEGLLRSLSRAPLLVVLAFSAASPRDVLDQLRARIPRDQPGMVIDLGPLDLAAVRALAGQVLPGYGDNELDRLARRVATDAAGLPLLAVELLHAVANGLELRQEGAAWPEPMHTLTQTRPGDLPDAVVGAIRVGFRRLSVPAQQTLIAAAVIGNRVPEALLAQATGLSSAPLRGALDELEWQRWLEAEPRGYGFVAKVAREVVARDMVTSGQRERVLAALRPAQP